MNRRYLEIAGDPRIIPGVHHYCDEFCDSCTARDRCLAYRCRAVYRKQHGRRDWEPTFRTVREALEFAREIGAVEGVPLPHIDAIMTGDAHGLKTDDPLTALAWEYALGVGLWLVFTPEEMRRLTTRPNGPAPEAIVLWHHLRIYMKLVRATLASARAAAGARHWQQDALGCAKVSLVSVQRSRTALLQLKTPTCEKTVGDLVALLTRVEQGIDERFPDARAFVRVGLDEPAA